jgi:hypothetical protein
LAVLAVLAQHLAEALVDWVQQLSLLDNQLVVAEEAVARVHLVQVEQAGTERLVLLVPTVLAEAEGAMVEVLRVQMRFPRLLLELAVITPQALAEEQFVQQLVKTLVLSVAAEVADLMPLAVQEALVLTYTMPLVLAVVLVALEFPTRQALMELEALVVLAALFPQQQ